MFARVIPALRLPRTLGVFDYTIPDGMTVQPGSLVTVQFRGKRVPAVVQKIVEVTEAAGKSIKPIISSLDVALPNDLLALIPWLAEHALVAPGLAAKTVIPEIPRRPGARWSLPPPRKGEDLRISRAALEHIRTVLGNLPDAKPNMHLLRYRATAEKVVALMEICKIQKRGILILVPRQADLVRLASVLRPRIPALATISSTLRPSILWEEWKRIRRGEAPVVLGTRGAVFAPLPKLKSVIVCDDESSEYKGDDSPRLDTRAVALERARQNGAAFFTISQAPRVETFVSVTAHGEPIELSLLRPDKVEVIDLAQEVREPGTVFCDKFITAVEEALAQDKSVAIFQNRRGAAGLLQCRDCGHAFNCPECKIPWTVHETLLKCHHCARTEPLPFSCPHCAGTRLKKTGGGTQRIETELRTRFPKASLVRLDSDAPEISSSELQKAQIIIGTRLLVGRLRELFEHLRPVGVVGIPFAELAMSHGNFRAAEYAYQWFTTVLNIGLPSNARVLIQTRAPDNSILQSAVRGDYEFYREESKSRAEFGYPPAARLTLLTYRAQMESAAIKESERTAAALREKFEKTAGTTLLGPFTPTPGKRAGTHLRSLLIKSPAGMPPPQELRALDLDWTIDADPEIV